MFGLYRRARAIIATITLISVGLAFWENHKRQIEPVAQKVSTVVKKSSKESDKNGTVKNDVLKLFNDIGAELGSLLGKD